MPFSQIALPDQMSGVVLTGHGGLDRLVYRTDLPRPEPGQGEVLIRVSAAGVNNTDINTRIGWYSKAVRAGTQASTQQEGADAADASWTGSSLAFPRIQGGDCCGRIVSVGEGVDPSRLNERVIVRNLLQSYVDYRPWECWTLGSEIDGAFAQYMRAPAAETYAVKCEWSDAELASIPCAYSTAEGLLHRAGVKSNETVLITGASGGVGSAAVQLAHRRGAVVIAVCGAAKIDFVRGLGAGRIVSRGQNLISALGENSVDVVIDVVGGSDFDGHLSILRRGGRLAVAGAIAGPLVEFDLRKLYLKDLTVHGCTFQEEEVFRNLVGYIERGEIRPSVSRTYALQAIARAQEDFLSKETGGKLVLIVP